MSSSGMSGREPTPAEIERMSADQYRAFIKRSTQSVRPVEQVRVMSTRELAERKSDIPEVEREITRSSHASLTHSVSPMLSLRQRQSIADFQNPPATPKSEAQLERERRAAACHEMELGFRRDAREREEHRAREQADRKNREAAAAKKASELKRCRGELELAQIARDEIFARYKLSDEEIFEVTNRLAQSPSAFRDIGGTLAEFYATQIVESRGNS